MEGKEMPIDNFLGKLKSTTEFTKQKTQVTLAINSLKSKIKPMIAEKAKAYELIGMEVYDLYTAGKLNLPEVASYYKKLDDLDSEIKKLQMEIENFNEKLREIDNEMKHALTGKPAQSRLSENTNQCKCGFKYTGNLKFCPQCGMKLEEEKIICTCGNEMNGNAKFCPSCGSKVGEASISSKIQNEQVGKIECVCGAMVDSTEIMCMECGRRINK